MAAKRTPKRGARLLPTNSSRKKSAQSKPVAQKSRSKVPKKNLSCPIVGIGGSAGGFEAAMELLRHLPPTTGMAFVIVQHLDPHHASRLPKLLGKVTTMPVVELREPTTPRPNTVYVQPPNECVIVKDGALNLIPRTQQLNLAIDHFFESLAEERGSRAIGVILSGSGTDGTAGLRAIKAAGGLTFAQSEESAKFDAMPRSAIRAGFVDAALPPREIAQEIRRVADHPYIRWPMADGESAKTRKEIYPEADDLGHPQPLIEIRKKLERDNRWSGELVHTCKDGTKVVVISRWSLDRDAQGGPALILETNTDISDWKRVEPQTAVNLAVTRILSESPALTDAVPRILQTICKTLGWDVGAFWTPEPDGRMLRCRNVWESSVGKFRKFNAASMKLTLSPGVGLPGRVWSNLKAAWVPDVTRGNNFPRSSVAAGEGLHGSFAFPISFGKKFLAVMECLSSEIREPDEDLLKTFASIGSQIGQFIQRKRTEEALQKSKEVLEKRVRQRTRELHVANKGLEDEIERRKGLEGEILAVSDREQQRLGQELHDGLCQHLTAVAFMARSVALRLKNHRVIDPNDLEKIAELVNNAAADTRNLSRALHRIDVDAAGLVEALQDLVDREIWKIPCRLQVRPSFRIENNVAAAHLYRIAREAVINANKHAQAREIVIKLERSQQGMVLRVTDDGVGFTNDPKLKPGLGYHIMNYRARLIGGRLKIERPKKGGTCVSCYFPDGATDPNKPVIKENGEQKRFATKIGKAFAALI
jgi:signal transduction histidine kinase/PAS domain-containing protein